MAELDGAAAGAAEELLDVVSGRVRQCAEEKTAAAVMTDGAEREELEGRGRVDGTALDPRS